MKIDSINNQIAQRRKTKEYSRPDSTFQRELNEVIRQAVGKHIHKPRPSTNVGWENNDGL